jgi:NAD(P)-dependent dehydrogenase (short-subunit alcohol dehydrogenase family)
LIFGGRCACGDQGRVLGGRTRAAALVPRDRPGTPLNDGIDDDPHVRRFLDAEVPLRRWAAPEELAGAALLLTDPQSGYITGTRLAGGRRLDEPPTTGRRRDRILPSGRRIHAILSMSVMESPEETVR